MCGHVMSDLSVLTRMKCRTVTAGLLVRKKWSREICELSLYVSFKLAPKEKEGKVEED